MIKKIWESIKVVCKLFAPIDWVWAFKSIKNIWSK